MINNLNYSEFRYRKTVGAIGFVMLFLFIFLYTGSFITSLYSELILHLPISRTFYVVSVMLMDGTFYFLSFAMPVFIFKKKIKQLGFSFQTMYAEPRLSPWLPLIIPAAILIVHVASNLNFSLITFFQGSAATPSTGTLIELEPYEIALRLLLTCVIPAFCEELLFRGAMLTNLVPFGKTNAIIISSLLFALMHGNPAQLLYTFVAGILIGVIYLKTGSIWNCIILHLFNNFFSVVEDVLRYNFYQSSDWAIPLWETLVYLVGSISLGILVFTFFSKKTSFKEGIYQKTLPATDSYAPNPVGAKRAVSLFFTPMMIIFLVLSVISVFDVFIGGYL